MESKKKCSCNCFSFLRRKKSKDPIKNNPQDVESLKNLSVGAILRAPESNMFMDLSTNNTQKLVQSNTYRSSIITPSRRTPKMHQFLPGLFSNQNAVKPDTGNSIETSLSRPNTMRDLPLHSSNHHHILKHDKSNINNKSPVLENPQKINEGISSIKQKQINPQIQNNHIIEENNKSNENWQIPEETDNISNSRHDFEKQEIPLKVTNDIKSKSKSVKKHENKLLCRSPGFSPIISPGLLSFSSKFSQSPMLASLNVSPIKCIVTIEDYSDIVSLLNDPDKCRNIPDVFIHCSDKPNHMPILKPATPCYFNKKKNSPVFCLESRAFVNKLKN
ncbi:hypothetical protein SteCoe_21465 [Stentor coeruleus]|uniref:Uncharacterized protein n=1 Tax=Stentor coeruleus TaxID=5963 RepID=A0A1R2BPM8_9CILI|nr:hypothetical protein SteCoe_21465 [Stentor coeruleus]